VSVEHLDCVHRQPLQLTHGRSFTCLLRTPYVGDNLWRRSCIVFCLYTLILLNYRVEYVYVSTYICLLELHFMCIASTLADTVVVLC